MKKKIWLSMSVAAVLLSASPVWSQDGFYVIAGGGRAGTQINSAPYTINSPGLYCLSGNLTYGSIPGNAITINAGDVTLDLMGYSLTGPGKTVGGLGIRIQDGCSNVEIRNGSVRSFGSDGINCSDSNASGVRVVGVRVRDTGGIGINLYGSNHQVMGCSAQNAGSSGIMLGDASQCKGNQVSGNGLYGIYVSSGSVTGNVCRSNYIGIVANGTTSVLDNHVLNNNTYGIVTSNYCTITRNTSQGNPSGGISASTYCTITNNTAQGLTYGSNCTLADNTVAP